MTTPDIHPDLFRPGSEMFGEEDPNIAFNRAWFNILRSHRQYVPQMTKALREVGLKDLVWYDIILEIERAGPDGQLMSALEDKLQIPQYALSRHISRLVGDGLLRREFIADGRRKQLLFLTEECNSLSARFWEAYSKAILGALSKKLTVEEAYLLTKLLIKIQD